MLWRRSVIVVPADGELLIPVDELISAVVWRAAGFGQLLQQRVALRQHVGVQIERAGIFDIDLRQRVVQIPAPVGRPAADDLHIVGQEHHHRDLPDQIGGAHHRAVDFDLLAKTPAVFGLGRFQHQHHVDVQGAIGAHDIRREAGMRRQSFFARQPVDQLPIAGGVRRSARGQHVDRFEQARLALRVIAVEQNRLRRQIDFEAGVQAEVGE